MVTVTEHVSPRYVTRPPVLLIETVLVPAVLYVVEKVDWPEAELGVPPVAVQLTVVGLPPAYDEKFAACPVVTV